MPKPGFYVRGWEMETSSYKSNFIVAHPFRNGNIDNKRRSEELEKSGKQTNFPRDFMLFLITLKQTNKRKSSTEKLIFGKKDFLMLRERKSRSRTNLFTFAVLFSTGGNFSNAVFNTNRLMWTHRHSSFTFDIKISFYLFQLFSK